MRGNVEAGLGEIKQAQQRLDKVYAAYAEPDADFDVLATEQALLENIIQADDVHNLERTLEVSAAFRPTPTIRPTESRPCPAGDSNLG